MPTVGFSRTSGSRILWKENGLSAMALFPSMWPWKLQWIIIFFCHDTCLRFMACPGCSRQHHFFWRSGVPLPFACIWDNIKCTSRSTWHHLPHLYGIWTTICSCLRLVELPGAEEVGALQSQAAPCSGEQQGYFSSARFPLPPWAGDGTRCGRCDASTLVKYLNFIY